MVRSPLGWNPELNQARSLATNLPDLWSAASTSAADRKEIVRLVVEKVVVDVQRDSEHTTARIHWRGGNTTDHQFVRPVNRYEQLEGFSRLRQRITELCRSGQTAADIATTLNGEGFRTPKVPKEYSKPVVLKLLKRFGLADERMSIGELKRNEWRLSDLAQEFQISDEKLRAWAVRGWVSARQTQYGFWIVWADASERKRLRKLIAHSRRGRTSFPKSWTTPKAQPQ